MFLGSAHGDELSGTHSKSVENGKEKKIGSSTQLFFFSVFTCTIEFLGCIVFDDPSLLVAGLLPLIFCLTQVTKRSVPCGISRQRVQHVWTDKKTR